MANCCDPIPYRSLFDEKAAEGRLREYRRRGLDKTAAGMVDFLRNRGVEGMTVLEVGGGVGEIQVELLEAGAERSVNVELSDGYEDAAARLLDEKGLNGRVERRLGDFVEAVDDLEPADIVVLNRVICCYPWMERMVEAATVSTGSLLVLAIPRDRWLGHVFIAVENIFHRIRGRRFRAFIHPVTEIESRVTRAGLTRVYARQDMFWRGLVFSRD
ncbi:MAG TPA: SAM-dependent methyltransferase [Acidimicrobiia bacterium]|nr:SAM-dependent methyltransferase [Acidimicrobiia bacterium]